MDIKIIIRRPSIGSASNNRLMAYAMAMSSLGIKVTIVYLITRDYRHIESTNKVTIVNLWESGGLLCHHCVLLSYLRSVCKLRKIINKGDVVLMYGDQVPIMLGLIFAKKKANIYCEVTEHPFHDGFSLRLWINTILSNFLLKQFDGMFVISNSLMGYYLSKGIKQDHIKVINMFVDYDRFSGLSHNCARPLYIAYCGKLSVRKDGVDTLIKAFAIFHGKYPMYRLMIIGGQENEKVLPMLQRLCVELHVEEYVDFVGQILPDEIPQLLYDASFLALARPRNVQSQNGFPTKLGEYLATGNPVVVTDVGEIGRFIKDCYNGFVSRPDDPEAFSESMMMAVHDIDNGNSVGLRGRELCFKEFSNFEQTKVALNFIDETIRVTSD